MNKPLSPKMVEKMSSTPRDKSTALPSKRPLEDKSQSKQPFPFKLHQLLQEADDIGTNHVISWLPSGKAFKIHDTNVFESSIMTNYFKQTKLKSFTRQLYIYGFSKISAGPHIGGFYHPQFRKGAQNIALNLTRRDSKEDRRCKKNRPKVLDALRTTSVGRHIQSANQSVAGMSMRHVRLPKSLLDNMPTSFSSEEANPLLGNLSVSVPKRALNLFDQTFGDAAEVDSRNPSLGRVTNIVGNQALQVPRSQLRADTLGHPAPMVYSSSRGWQIMPMANRMLPLQMQHQQSQPFSSSEAPLWPWSASVNSALQSTLQSTMSPSMPQHVSTSTAASKRDPLTDILQIEPRPIEEMLDPDTSQNPSRNVQHPKQSNNHSWFFPPGNI